MPPQDQAPTNSAARQPSLGTGVLCSIIAACLLVVANSAYWFHSYIFEPTTFTQITTQAINEESSRQAIANDIVDRLFSQRPILKGLVDEPASKLITGFLASNLAQKTISKAVTAFQTILTSPQPQALAFDLTSIKQFLGSILAVAQTISRTDQLQAGDIRLEELPDALVIINAEGIPNLYQLGLVLLWVGPLAVIGAVVLFGYPVYQARRDRQLVTKLLAIEGASILLAGLLALLIGPLLQPPLLANVQSPHMRIVVENIYHAFAATFTQQTRILFILGGLLLLIAVGMSLAKPISRWVRDRQG